MTRASILFAALLAILLPLSLLAGRVWIDPFDTSGTANAALILMELRLPRAVLAVVIGAGLGAAGAAMQGYLRNPLADPGLFGIAPMAALGAVASFWTGLSYALPIFALAGAALAMVLLALIAGRTASGAGGGIALFTLAGLMIASLAGTLTALAITMAPSAFAMSQIVMWLNGAITDRSWAEVWIAAPLTLIGIAVLMVAGRALDALTLGEDAAASLGINLPVLRLRIIFGVAAMIGAATAVAGAVGFVGLVVPHLLRGAVGAEPGRLLPASALGGAAMVQAADIAVRVVLPGRDLKLGVVMALIGAPIFLHLIWRQRRGF